MLPGRSVARTGVAGLEGGEDPRERCGRQTGLRGERKEPFKLATGKSVCQAVLPPWEVFKGGNIVTPGPVQEQATQECQDVGMFGGFVLPGCYDRLVVAEETNPLSTPEVAPGESSRHDSKQFLPLDGPSGSEQLVRLPRVVEPAALEVSTAAKGARGVGVKVDVSRCGGVWVKEAC